jgi:alanine racemase
VSSVTFSSGPQREAAQAILTVDLGALAENWKLLSARVTPAECGAVVKADA